MEWLPSAYEETKDIAATREGVPHFGRLQISAAARIPTKIVTVTDAQHLPSAAAPRRPHRLVLAPSAALPASPTSMEQFEDGLHVRLRSRMYGTYLRADEDGEGVSLHPDGASLRTVWGVHLLVRDGVTCDLLCLHNAAYGKYIAASGKPLRLGLGPRGYGVALRNYDHMEEYTVRWMAVPSASAGHILLRSMYGGGKLRVHCGYLNNFSVYLDNCNEANAAPMEDWKVEAVPLEELPTLLRPQPQLIPAQLSPFFPSPRRPIFLLLAQPASSLLLSSLSDAWAPHVILPLLSHYSLSVSLNRGPQLRTQFESGYCTMRRLPLDVRATQGLPVSRPIFEPPHPLTALLPCLPPRVAPPPGHRRSRAAAAVLSIRRHGASSGKIDVEEHPICLFLSSFRRRRSSSPARPPPFVSAPGENINEFLSSSSLFSPTSLSFPLPESPPSRAAQSSRPAPQLKRRRRSRPVR
ncbi:hypothetical protein HU200_016761 [Digitaria exilis]|uniref:DUF569 domain-containing protein n=1 Tax=Digitaria exilis TaxID=1010633 RepID=A0A835F7X3_9POAL|nr:hypothetical protein HU200_016761 [Digitaria exilis]